MAYALVLASKKPINKDRGRLFQKICDWFRGFMAVPVHVSYKEIDKSLFLYIITMPRPEVFYSRNRIGKKRTLKKWASAIENNNIEHYLLETPLREYINGGWTIDKYDYLAESLKKNMHLLFTMNPLKGLKVQNMTVTLSGVKKEFIWPQLMPVLRKFKLLNVIDPDNSLQDMWDEFMAETGVPVCITEDCGVLSRSHIWISYEDANNDYPFNGIKVAACTKSIICPNDKRQFLIGYTFQKKLLKKLGIELVQRFNNHELSEFLLHMLINIKDVSIPEAEEILGVKISIITIESLIQCS
ncbi:MAG: hypothetical protein GX213_10730 [Clostridiaceae bacterium]|nr:hypothetical protein [Clostridiaceae bacterium]